ncbi:hypothetical protein RQM47_06710 [Rubrivirga sp. S365]|nr:hypothetical protein [Rubrivirga sp. S365]MDT7856325.1 hypothetical protein [Rubrivirga sp. S365]
MATLTLQNVPDDLHRRLKERAERNRRSIDREAVRLLEEAVRAPQPEKDEAWEQATALRERLAARGFKPLTAEEVQEAIEQGRP